LQPYVEPKTTTGTCSLKETIRDLGLVHILLCLVQQVG